MKVLRILRFFGRALRETLRPGPAVVISMVAVTPMAYLIDLLVLLILRARGFRIVLYIHGTDYRARAEKGRVRNHLCALGFRRVMDARINIRRKLRGIVFWLTRQDWGRP